MFSKTKKVLAALLTLTMVIGLLPTTVLADEVLPEAPTTVLADEVLPEAPTTVLADEVLPEAAPAAQAEELAVSAITVREYHVPYSAMTDIRAYCVAASGSNLSKFNCTMVKFKFNDGYWVLGGANGAQDCWSATPTNVDRHQPADLASVEFTFYRVFKSIKVSIPASELSVVSYDKDHWLDIAEVTMKADAPEPEPTT
ncbi:MAG: hypothetical protein RRY53_02665, partial [Pseudoflavonifractor sp.]